jgi:hypothetical protein
MPYAVGLCPTPLGCALRHWVLPSSLGSASVVGLCLRRWALCRRWALPIGLCLRRWAMPFVVGLCPWLYPTPLGYALRRWAVPYAIGLYPTPLGCTLRRWVVPYVVGLYSTPLSCTLRRWVVPYAVGLYPTSLGYALRRWALSLWHLLSRRRGPSSSSLFPEAGIVGERTSVGWNERRNEENEPRHSSWFVFMTHYMGLPHPGSPLMFLPSPFLHRVNLSRPHPSRKGRGGCSGVRVLTF